MKVKMSRAKFLTSVWRDRYFVRQHTILVVEHLQCARVLRLGWGAFIAARDQDCQSIVGRHAHLVGKDAGVDWTGLSHLLTRREVFVDAIDAHGTRIVERYQDVLRRNVRAHVNGTRRQAYGVPVRLE